MSAALLYSQLKFFAVYSNVLFKKTISFIVNWRKNCFELDSFLLTSLYRTNRTRTWWTIWKNVLCVEFYFSLHVCRGRVVMHIYIWMIFATKKWHTPLTQLFGLNMDSSLHENSLKTYMQCTFGLLFKFSPKTSKKFATFVF